MEEKPDFDYWIFYQTWPLETGVCLVRGLPLKQLTNEEQIKEFQKWLGIIHNNLASPYYGVDQIEHEIVGGGHTFGGQIHVKVKSFLKWCLEHNAIVPEYLKKLTQEFFKPQNSKNTPKLDNLSVPATVSKVHGNSERFSNKREKILNAALAAVTNDTKRCQKNGKFVGKQIVDVIEQDYQDLVLKDNNTEEWIMSKNEMIRLINGAINYERSKK